jgi:NADPH:quinone reductase-like Zn-dependent oxidoreductase
MTPKTMQAIKIVSAGKAEVQTVPVPTLRDHYILVKVNAIAINPVRAPRRSSTSRHPADHNHRQTGASSKTTTNPPSFQLTNNHRKHVDIPALATTGVTVGCDFTGTVVALGPKVSKDYKVGDRIAGVTHGSNASNPEDGTFGEYCVAKEGLTFKVPQQMSDEQAATVGVAVTTIGHGLYNKLGMPMPGSQKTGEGQWLLVYGGSTAMGTFAIQCAVLSGYKVVATCSPRNFDVRHLDILQHLYH